MRPLDPTDPQRRPLSHQCRELSGARQYDTFFRRAGIVVEPFTVEKAHVARRALHDFGKGRHPAGSNFGDCLACALTKITGEPLLFKRKDFKKTDIVSAL
jgi:ribonuclease VapC